LKTPAHNAPQLLPASNERRLRDPKLPSAVRDLNGSEG